MRPIIRTPNVRRFVGPIAGCCEHYGFNLNRPLNTVDGDEVSIYAIDTEHPYPLVGEVFDYNAGVSWLARWDEQGVYRGTDRATSRHSLQTNSRPHALIDNGQTRPTLGSANGFNPSDYQSFGPHFIDVTHVGDKTINKASDIYAHPSFKSGGEAARLDAGKIVDDLFDREVKPTPPVLPEKLSKAEAAPLEHFGTLLARSTVAALRTGEATPMMIAHIASHAARIFAQGRITLDPAVDRLSFTTLERMVRVMVAQSQSVARIELAASRNIHAVDVTKAERQGKAAVDNAIRTSRPGGIDNGNLGTSFG